MSFNSVALKMLRVNYRRYLAYFVCNALSITLFFCFASLFTNDSFMKNPAIDSSISSNVTAPSFLVAVFIILFVPYSHSAFQKLRRNDYGILMTLGMTENEILLNMLFENGVIALLSVVFGLLLGTGISACFYGFIIKVIGISALTYEIKWEAYKVTILLYGAVFVLTLMVSLMQSIKMKVVDLIKEKYKGDKVKKSYRAMFYLGIVMLSLAIIIMVKYYTLKNTDIWFLSMLLCFVGTYFIIGNSELIIVWLEKNNKPFYIRNNLFLSDLKYHFHSSKKILLAMVWLFDFAIFFIVLAIVTYPSLTKNATTYTPYHMEFVQMDGMNKISEEALEKILAAGSTKVTEAKTMGYLRNGAFNIFSDTQVNSTLKRNYKVKKGTFMEIFQYGLKDGYSHDFQTPEELFFICNKEKVKLKAAGSKTDILVDKNFMADRSIMVNDADYELIKNTSKDYEAGIIKLFNFQDWRNSEKLVEALQMELDKINANIKAEQKYYKITSRIEKYETAKKSSWFLISLIAFIFILFWISANVILYLKLQLEFEAELKNYTNLYKVGLQESEAQLLVLNKLKFMFLVPVFFAAILAMIYSYFVFDIYNFGWLAMVYCAGISLATVVVQFAFVKIYTDRYWKKLCL